MTKMANLRKPSSGIVPVFVVIGCVSFVTNALMLTGPLYMLQIYDRVLSSGSVQTLIALSLLVIGIYIFFSILDGVRSVMLNRVAALFESKWAEPMFLANVLLPLRMPPGKGQIEPVRDLDICRQFLAGQGPIAIFDLPWLPIYLFIVYLFHPWLGLLGLVGALALLTIMLSNEFLSRAPVQENTRALMSRTSFASSARANPGAVVAMGMLDNMARVWTSRTSELLGAHRKSGDRAAGFSSATKGIRFAIQSGILGLGAYLAIRGDITPGVMIAGSIITARALAPVEQAVANWRGLVAARQSYRRLKIAYAETAELAPETDLPMPGESLTVEGMACGPRGGRPVIAGFDFRLEAGDGMGVIGPSGSGKTTLARAIVGIWPIYSGAVRLDGAKIDQWSHDRLGKTVGYLPQEVELFDGTIGQNIARFSPEPSAEDIVAAARLAGIHELVNDMENGYDTRLGENGFALSAGQRQRVGLARALYGDPFLVVLDEPNANLDMEGDKSLAQAILSVRRRGGIVIVNAHRPSAIAAVDKLLFVRNGRQEKFGPKNEVLSAITRNPEAASQAASALKVVSDAE